MQINDVPKVDNGEDEKSFSNVPDFGGAEDEKSFSDEKKQLTADDLKAELERLRSTNERLLNENQQHKLKRKRAEEAKLEAEGKKDELIQSLRSEIQELSTEKSSLYIAGALEEEARKRGCARWNHLYALTGGAGIEYDPESGQVLGVKEFFDNCENDNEFSYFFNKKRFVETDNFTPSNNETAIDYRKEPLKWLKHLKTISQAKYNEGVLKLQREGIIR